MVALFFVYSLGKAHMINFKCFSGIGNVMFSFFKSNAAQKEPVEIKEGQRWCMPDAFVDQFCEPILTTIIEVKDGFVTHANNYGVTKRHQMSMFRSLYTFQA